MGSSGEKVHCLGAVFNKATMSYYKRAFLLLNLLVIFAENADGNANDYLTKNYPDILSPNIYFEATPGSINPGHTQKLQLNCSVTTPIRYEGNISYNGPNGGIWPPS